MPETARLTYGSYADFSDVRIHTGGKAADAAEAIDAKAFTCGNDIVFNSGEYDPQSPEGQFLLAHELAHVKQQTDAPLSMMPQANADLEIDPDPQLERDADRAAKEALQGDDPVTVNRLGTDVHVQRAPKNTDALQTLAMLEIENENESHSEFRENQNQNRIPHLRTAISDVYQDAEEIEGDEDMAEIKKKLRLKELNEKLGDKLDDVGLTDDQRQKLQQGIDTGDWADYGTPAPHSRSVNCSNRWLGSLQAWG